MRYSDKPLEEIQLLLEKELKQYKKFQSMKLSLDMSRGKPCTEQLDLARPMFDIITAESDFKLSNGTDARNYGGLDGIPELRNLFADIFNVRESQVFVNDNSSLSIMYTTVVHAKLFGIDGNIPWGKLPKVKFICLTPGYDRHFGICESLGIEMISVPMTDKGINMDMIEALVENDSTVKGIWCVPKYSNPSGITYSDEVVDRLAKMKTAAPDFRIFWDNAYFTHFVFSDDKLKNIFEAIEKAGNPDRVYMFSSTSKITCAGSGVSLLISSEKNLAEFKSHYKYQTIGPNRIMQLMHYRYIKSVDNLKLIMEKHAEILRPKFEMVFNTLSAEFENGDILSWTNCNGGYFVSINVLTGSAKRVVSLAKDAGVIFTNAGATYPLNNDDKDSNIRIAPSFPAIEELETAMQVLINAIKISAFETILAKNGN